MMRTAVFIALIILEYLLAVDAHGYVVQPMATYLPSDDKTRYITTVDGNLIFPGLKWNDNPDKNADQLKTKIDSGELPDLKTFFSKYVNGCPRNDMTVQSVNVDNLNSIQWENDFEHKGFIPSHEGPCEVWIDSRRVFNDTNCAKHYTSFPATMPVDYSSCNGECQLDFYWLALHEYNWQLYKACVKINHSRSSTPSVTPAISSNTFNTNTTFQTCKCIC